MDAVDLGILATGWLAAIVCGIFAVVVLAASPRSSPNRILALLFATLGYSNVGWETGAPPELAAVLNFFAVGVFTVHSCAYVALLAHLDTPLVRFLRARSGRLVAYAGLALAAVPALYVFGGAALSGATPPADYGAMWAPLMLGIATLVFALVASISAYRRAPAGTAAKERAKFWAIAFGFRDSLLAMALLLTVAAAATADSHLTHPYFLLAELVFYPLSTLLAVPLLAYGILRTQLFDIDLRIKAGVRSGVLGGVFVAVFVAVAIVAERMTTAAFGIALSGVVTALLMFAIVPLHRFAQRAADRLMPSVSNTEDYLAKRRLEVYRAAVEDAIARGGDTEKDPVLAQLRRSLGITLDQHRVMAIALAPRPSRATASAASQYAIERELGRGGGGRAVLATDRALGRRVVLKQPLALAAADGALRERVLREARIAASIQHPNVVAVYHVLADEDPPVIVMEHVDGESLADRLAREGPLAPEAVARVALDVLAGLDRIHGEGIIHRDIKPANILLDKEGRAKITDFGVAHAPLQGDAARAATVTGLHPGSPAYMSPEQARGEPLDARSDIYALGLVLHEALHGRAHEAPGATRAPGTSAAPSPKPRGPLDEVVARALAPDPAARPADAATMSADVARALPAAKPRA